MALLQSVHSLWAAEVVVVVARLECGGPKAAVAALLKLNQVSQHHPELLWLSPSAAEARKLLRKVLPVLQKTTAGNPDLQHLRQTVELHRLIL
jgi:hypothetical protein